MPCFELYPAIDVKDGRAVRLAQGRPEKATVYASDPADAAWRWITEGARWLHVVDLDGALAGVPRNQEAVRAIIAIAGSFGIPVQLGGGLRTLAAVESALSWGASRVIIGTKAVGSDLIAQAVMKFGADRVVVSIDASNGMVATDGWVNVTSVEAVELARQAGEAGVRTLIYTDIAKDGMMSGPNLAELAVMGQAAVAAGQSIIASGGISSVVDIRRLTGIPGIAGAVLGKAIYTGAVALGEALAVCR